MDGGFGEAGGRCGEGSRKRVERPPASKAALQSGWTS